MSQRRMAEPTPVLLIKKTALLTQFSQFTKFTHMTDHYAALGLSSDASLADVKKAFRQKASIYHPDRNAAPDAPARFRAVQAAFDVLSDADKRQAYDDNRKRNLLDSPIDTAREIWQAYFSQVVQAAASK